MFDIGVVVLEFCCGFGVGYVCDVLFDDWFFVEVCCCVVGGCVDEFDVVIFGMCVGVCVDEGW